MIQITRSIRSPLILVLLLSLVAAGCSRDERAQTAAPGPSAALAASTTEAVPLPVDPEGVGEAAEAAPPDREITEVRAIYVTGWITGSTKRWSELVDLVGRTELNAMVIDVKEDGMLSYDIDIPLARAINANHKMAPDIDEKLAELREKDIFPIARITVFRDRLLPKHKRSLAIQRPDGAPWRDPAGHHWLDPYNRENWDYSVDVAIDAAKRGFREIQWDYVRFPSEGRKRPMKFPAKAADDQRSEARVIADFLKYAREKLEPYDVVVSADVFGLTTSVDGDMGIGQNFELMAEHLDVICPMVYPSHYGKGEYGLANPNRSAYQTVFHAMRDGNEKLKGKECKLRPWLQDFSLGGVTYGEAQVRAQIQAARDNGITEYLLWNAANRYTSAALVPKPEAKAAPAAPPKQKTRS